jgi:hypothetical protein
MTRILLIYADLLLYKIVVCYLKALALIAVEILLFFSLKNKRLQRIAGIAPKLFNKCENILNRYNVIY